jgi:hypothetical protein
VKRIFSAAILVVSVIGNANSWANTKYELWANGETQELDGHIHTKVVLGGRQYSDNINKLPIARLYAQRNILLYPFRQIEWPDDYSKETQWLLTNQFLRTVKLSSRLKGLEFENQWVQGGHYNFVFSIPGSQVLLNPQYTSDQIIASLQHAVQASDIKLNYAAMLEIGLRHPGVFNLNLIASQFNSSFGKNLLKFMTGVPIDDTEAWKGDERVLPKLTLEELFLLQSKHPYDQNISYYLATALKAQNFDYLMRRVVENCLNSKLEPERSPRMALLAEDLGISSAP